MCRSKNRSSQPWYLAINPFGVVPALVHHGRTIIQSTIITEYLDDASKTAIIDPALPDRIASMWTTGSEAKAQLEQVVMSS
jgi:glutathione S-transferase